MVSAQQIIAKQKQKNDPKPLEKVSAEEELNEINRSFAEKKTEKFAEKLKIPYINIADKPINADLLSKIDSAEVQKTLAIPFFQLGKKMFVAIADPEKNETQKYLKKLKDEGIRVQLNVASREGILDKNEQIRALQPQRPKEFQNEEAEFDLKNYEDELNTLKLLSSEAEKISAKESLNRLFVGALRTGASDIHFQPSAQKIVIRFRIDGILQKLLEFDRTIGNDILNQLKFEAKLRINVENVPQDGRTSFLAGDRKIDVRVATLPTEFGESIVCRILDSGKKIPSLAELGFNKNALKNLENVIDLREGMLLVTGPTGSGKTTTLYTVLANLNNSERKIVTLENPIEYHFENVVQSQIDSNVNYGFADGLRALLRQDPNVLMVGEIRDEATAETATQAAMTGHILLSTLHANSAIDTIPRILNLGVKPFVLISSLKTVVAQRLLRRPCLKCAQKVSIDKKLIDKLTPLFDEIKRINPNAIDSKIPEFLYEPKGCPACGGTGYHGQIAIAESFQIDTGMSELILKNAPPAELTNYVRKQQKMLSFAEDGLLKVAAGKSTLAEVARVTGLNLVN